MKHATTLLVFCTSALLSLGLVTLFSSTARFQLTGPVGLQLFWCGIGLVAAGVAAAVDYRWLRRLAWPLFAVAVALLAAVLVFGERVYGSIRWLEVGPVRFQPSEFAKLALIVALAGYVERNHRRMPTFLGGVVLPLLLIGAVLGLIFAEPDWGTTLVLAGVAVVMLLVGGVRWSHLIPIGVVAVALLGVALAHNPVRLKRVQSWLDLESSRSDVGVQAYQSKLALGSGGLTGTGLGSGAHYGNVPLNQSDFIFAILGEELGLVCTLGVVAAFAVFVICGVRIAWGARDVFGLLLGTGLTFAIGLQALVNIGVVIGLLPNKGLVLPFVSRGGSSMVVLLVFVGVLLSIARTTARENLEEEPEVELEDAAPSG